MFPWASLPLAAHPGLALSAAPTHMGPVRPGSPLGALCGPLLSLKHHRKPVRQVLSPPSYRAGKRPSEGKTLPKAPQPITGQAGGQDVLRCYVLCACNSSPPSRQAALSPLVGCAPSKPSLLCPIAPWTSPVHGPRPPHLTWPPP